MNVIGYLFELEFRGGQRVWTRLRGRGGEVGDGTLHVQDPERISWVADRLLARVRAELRREGRLFEHVDTPSGPRSFRSEEVKPADVTGCKPRYERKVQK